MAVWSDDCGERVRFFIQWDFAKSDVGVQLAKTLTPDNCLSLLATIGRAEPL